MATKLIPLLRRILPTQICSLSHHENGDNDERLAQDITEALRLVGLDDDRRRILAIENRFSQSVTVFLLEPFESALTVPLIERVVAQHDYTRGVSFDTVIL